ncbi:MAG: M24 family metallopeptidase [Lentihominibacter sp.]
MISKLDRLRNEMKREGMDAYIIPSSDYNGSEYVSEHFRCREYMSGFTGSAGTLLVELEEARLWTDGRYFIQADRQLEGSGIRLMKSGEDGVPSLEEYIESLPEDSVVGFDGRTISRKTAAQLEKSVTLMTDKDLVDRIWEERPPLETSPVYSIDISVTGETSESKLSRVRDEMRQVGADYILVNKPEEVAWLFNMRGSDIPCTPVFYAFALVSMEGEELFLLKDGADEIYRRLGELRDCSIIMSDDSVSCAAYGALHESVEAILMPGPVEKLKAVKNHVEIEATRRAHIRDGAAMAEFLCMVKTGRLPADATEMTVSRMVDNLRYKRGARDVSFTTIAAFEENGAVIHYTPAEEVCRAIDGNGLLLVDSGGQYPDGTTDITRTVAIGEVSAERKRAYTAVLKGHIALALAEFTDEDGSELDEKARGPIRELGYDYRHGTGHGVGHMLSVHEGPNLISPSGKGSRILPGMITTDEPGVYMEGDFGIRIENELLCVEKDGVFAFEPLTLCPYDRDAIDRDMLTEEEICYIDEYHSKVYRLIKPLLDGDVPAWLEEACRPIDTLYTP